MATPTVVLVHGAFADSSYWGPVIEILLDHDVPVLAPANPLRGLASDAAYLASLVEQLDGPVLLVGHSYGGAVISVAAANAPSVVGLVYVAAFALDEGESISDVYATYGDTALAAGARPSQYPLPDGGTAVELTIAPEAYADVFAADLPAERVRALAVRQRPLAAVLDEKAQAVAWRTLPTWFLVATGDHAIPPAGERGMAERMGAHTVEVDASHSFGLSQPAATADLIQTALGAVG